MNILKAIIMYPSDKTNKLWRLILCEYITTEVRLEGTTRHAERTCQIRDQLNILAALDDWL